MIYARLTILFIQVSDNLRIGLRAEAVTTALQRGAQRLMVVYLSVENDTDRPIFVVDRLMSAAQIDNAEAGVEQSDAVVDMVPHVIWAPVP